MARSSSSFAPVGIRPAQSINKRHVGIERLHVSEYKTKIYRRSTNQNRPRPALNLDRRRLCGVLRGDAGET